MVNQPLGRMSNTVDSYQEKQSIAPLGLSLLSLAALSLTVTESVSPTAAVTLPIIIGILSAAYHYRASKNDPFHPAVFPTLYVIYAMVLPITYTGITGRQIRQVSFTTLNVDTIYLMASFSLALIALTSAIPARKYDDTIVQTVTVNYRRAEIIGNIALGLAAVAKIVQIYASQGLAYGEGQTEYGLRAFATTAAEGLLLIAVLAIVVSRTGDSKTAIGKTQVFTLAMIAAASFVTLGSRGEMIAPTIIILWGYTRYRRPPALVTGATAIGAIALFNWVGNFRSQNNNTDEFGNILERSFVDTSTPITITDTLVSLRQLGLPPLGGETYLSSLQMTAPGFITRALMDGTPTTATYIYRELIGLDNPNSGVGFSFASEAYLNFGSVGLVLAGALGGSIIALTLILSRHTQNPFYASMYIIAIANLPYALRSDSLSLIKLILYPALAMVILSFLTLEKGRKAAHQSFDKEARNVDHRNRYKNTTS